MSFSNHLLAVILTWALVPGGLLAEDGAIDTTFAVSGRFFLDFHLYAAGSHDWGNVAVRQPDGKILIGGYANQPPGGGADGEMAYLRLMPDGRLDPGFGKQGSDWVQFHDLAIYGSSRVDSIELRPDGRILLIGTLDTTSVVFAQLLSDGTLDPDFGVGGRWVWSPPPGGRFYVHTSALQPDGKVLVGGRQYVAQTAYSEVLVARFQTNGLSDVGFGTGGLRTLSVRGNSVDQLNTLVVRPTGQIVGGGSSLAVGYPWSGLLFELQENGGPDISLALVTIFPAYNSIEDLILEPDGSLLAALTTVPGETAAALVRIKPDLRLDLNYGRGQGLPPGVGALYYGYAEAVGRQSDGKALLLVDQNNGFCFVERLQADGKRDSWWPLPIFGIGPANSYSFCRDMVVHKDGVVIAGAARITGAGFKEDFAALGLQNGVLMLGDDFEAGDTSRWTEESKR